MKRKLVGTARDFRNLCIELAIMIAVITILGLIMAIISNIWALFIVPLCLTIIPLFSAILWHIKYTNETYNTNFINSRTKDKKPKQKTIYLKSIYQNPSNYIIKSKKDDDSNGKL